MIFDEIVTGFRLAIGGAQEYFGVTPDLAVFAKGIANGMPLAAYVGRRAIMKNLNDVIVSSTYGGETLSLAAAKAAITVYRDEDVIGHLWRQGETLCKGLDALFAEHGVPVRMAGYFPCSTFRKRPDAPDDIMERIFSAAYRNGLSIYNNLYINFSHSDSDMEEALERWEKACIEIAL